MAGGVPYGSLGDYVAQDVTASIAEDLGVTGLTDFVPGVNLITLPYTIYNMVQMFQSFFAGVPREAKTLGPADLLVKSPDMKNRLLGDYIIRQYKGHDMVLSSVRTASYNPARYMRFLCWLTQTDPTQFWNPKGYLDIPPPPGAPYSKHVLLGWIGAYPADIVEFRDYKAPGVLPNFADVCVIGGWSNPGNYNPLSGGQWLQLKIAVSRGALNQDYINQMASDRGIAVGEMLNAYQTQHGGWQSINPNSVLDILAKIATIPTNGLTAAQQQSLINGGHPTPVPNPCDVNLNKDLTYLDTSQDGVTKPITPPAGQPNPTSPAPSGNILETIANDLRDFFNRILKPTTPPTQQDNKFQEQQNQQQNNQQNNGGVASSDGSNAGAASNPTIIIGY